MSNIGINFNELEKAMLNEQEAIFSKVEPLDIALQRTETSTDIIFTFPRNANQKAIEKWINTWTYHRSGSTDFKLVMVSGNYSVKATISYNSIRARFLMNIDVTKATPISYYKARLFNNYNVKVLNVHHMKKNQTTYYFDVEGKIEDVKRMAYEELDKTNISRNLILVA